MNIDYSEQQLNVEILHRNDTLSKTWHWYSRPQIMKELQI